MKPCLYVCDTCCYRQAPAGEELLEYLREAAAQSARGGDFEIRATTCFMACAQGCNVHLRAPGKVSYLAGKFAPTAQSATAIVQFVERYLASDQGDVPYMETPRGMMGHVLARMPVSED